MKKIIKPKTRTWTIEDVPREEENKRGVFVSRDDVWYHHSYYAYFWSLNAIMKDTFMPKIIKMAVINMFNELKSKEVKE